MDAPQHDLDSSPVDWVIDQPSSAAVFDRWGIDYSCPGKSLAYQCERLGLDPADVMRQLREPAAGANDHEED
jgi:regulator of cell morphogenesis and NO signaling